MKQLTCEMCGGTDLLKQDGVFVCQSCGCKYSVEEAKKMMVEVSGAVQVDSSHLSQNFLSMVENAIAMGNNAEAEQYCNKILETDQNNYKAWFYKGKAAGWQSNIHNIRFPEAVNCFTSAINLTPEDEKESLAADSSNEIKKLALALISTRCDRFIKWPDGEEAAGFINDLTVISSAIVQFFNGTGVLISDYEDQIASIVQKTIINTYNKKIQPDYEGTDNRPSDYDFQQYIQRIDNCITISTIALKQNNLSDSIQLLLYRNLITLQERACEAKSVHYAFTGDYSFIDGSKIYGYIPKRKLSDTAKAARNSEINKYKAAINIIESKIAAATAARQREKEARERAEHNSFWDVHKEEKNILATEKDKLNAKKSTAGFEQNKVIVARITAIDEILKKQRKGIDILSDEEKKIVREAQTGTVFSELDSLVDYDAYLDKYPILKQKETIAIELENAKQLNEKMKSRTVWDQFVTRTQGKYALLWFNSILGIILFVEGAALEYGGVSFIGFLVGVPSLIAVVVFSVKLIKEKALINQQKITSQIKIDESKQLLEEINMIPVFGESDSVYKDYENKRKQTEIEKSNLESAKQKRKKAKIVLFCVLGFVVVFVTVWIGYTK